MLNLLVQRIVKPLKQLIDFKGRSTKEEYWTFVLCWGFIIFLIANYLPKTNKNIAGYQVSAASLLHSVVMIALCISICVRRLHDTNRSGLWWLIAFVPIIGAIWLLILLCSDGTKGQNDYGPEPLSDYTAPNNNRIIK